MIATVTVGLSLATAVLGLGLVGIGYLKLAQYVQLLPTWYECYRVSLRFLIFISWIRCLAVSWVVILVRALSLSHSLSLMVLYESFHWMVLWSVGRWFNGGIVGSECCQPIREH